MSVHCKIRRPRPGLLQATLLSLLLAPLIGSDSQAAEPAQISGFGSNPGNLEMWVVAPQNLPESPPLVVALHGCTVHAAEYAAFTGWTDLAASQGFVLLLPETSKKNNPQLCFRWFDPSQASRGSGEAESIVQMIDHLHETLAFDRSRVFVTGHSAGGGMTAVMLATYPDRFAGGSIIAGIPFRCATNSFMAMGCMTGLAVNRSAKKWLAYVRQASSHTGPWPRVQLWHGGRDPVVNVLNGKALTEQWTAVHGIDSNPEVQETVKGSEYRGYKDAAGNLVVESYLLKDMKHTVPIDPGPNQDQCGSPNQHASAVGICSSYYATRFWGMVAE